MKQIWVQISLSCPRCSPHLAGAEIKVHLHYAEAFPIGKLSLLLRSRATRPDQRNVLSSQLGTSIISVNDTV